MDISGFGQYELVGTNGNLEFVIRTLRAQLHAALGRIRESACAVSQQSRGLNDTAGEAALAGRRI